MRSISRNYDETGSPTRKPDRKMRLTAKNVKVVGSLEVIVTLLRQRITGSRYATRQQPFCNLLQPPYRMLRRWSFPRHVPAASPDQPPASLAPCRKRDETTRQDRGFFGGSRPHGGGLGVPDCMSVWLPVPHQRSSGGGTRCGRSVSRT